MAVDLARDDADQRPAVVGRDQCGVTTLDGLVARRRELVLLRQVHPELDAVEQAAAVDEFGRRRLDVQDARAGGHPLGRSVGDQPPPPWESWCANFPSSM